MAEAAVDPWLLFPLQAKFVPGQLHGLLQISLDARVDPAVQQAAGIAFKNGVKEGWDLEDGSRFSVEEKAAIRTALPQGLITASAAIKRQLRETTKIIVYADYPAQWPGLLHLLAEALASQASWFECTVSE